MDPRLRCSFCEELPDFVKQQEHPEPLPGDEVFCATNGCPAFSNVVSLEVWNKRAPHEQRVANIPLDEPIFVLRAKDALALVPMYTWIDLAERKKVNEAKIASAVNDTEAFQSFQRANGSRIPD